MTDTERDIALTKAIVRSIEHCTGYPPRKRSMWPFVTGLALYLVVATCVVAASLEKVL
jgi:hypothetical protein